VNHDELAFIAEVSSANQAIAVYIGRVLDVDGGCIEYRTALPELEQRLAARLLAIGQALQANATGRTDATEPRRLPEKHPDLPATEGKAGR
jgi:hypothetical protein